VGQKGDSLNIQGSLHKFRASQTMKKDQVSDAVVFYLLFRAG
jgi:hypothetical protein